MILQTAHSCFLHGLNPCKRPSANHHKRYSSIIRATSHDESHQDALQKGSIDSNMAMLHRRITQLRANDIIEMIEPIEKGHCATLFESNNLEILGLLQFDDLFEKPRIAIGVTIMGSFCLPVSVLVVMLYMIDMAKVVVDRVHVITDNKLN